MFWSQLYISSETGMPSPAAFQYIPHATCLDLMNASSPGLSELDKCWWGSGDGSKQALQDFQLWRGYYTGCNGRNYHEGSGKHQNSKPAGQTCLSVQMFLWPSRRALTFKITLVSLNILSVKSNELCVQCRCERMLIFRRPHSMQRQL